MSMSFFVGEITDNKPSTTWPERQSLTYAPDPQCPEVTVADLIYECLSIGERSLTQGRVWFHMPDGLWVQIIVDSNKITLELGEPAA